MKMYLRLFVLLLACVVEVNAETVQVKTRVKCYYCSGNGYISKTVKDRCAKCEGRGYTKKTVTTSGAFKSITKRENCPECRNGYIPREVQTSCTRCEGSGYQVETKSVQRERKPSMEEKERKLSARQEKMIKRNIEIFIETNSLSIALFNSQHPFSEEGCCYGGAAASNRLDNAIYRMKVIEVLPENRFVSDLVKFTLYDQKQNRPILLETFEGGYSINDILRDDTFYKYIGIKEYKDRFGRKKALPCLKEISKEEYNVFVEERVRGQYDTW